MLGYTLEYEIKQVENKLNRTMNEYFEKLHLQGMNREEKTLRDIRKLINKLNHKLAYLKAYISLLSMVFIDKLYGCYKRIS